MCDELAIDLRGVVDADPNTFLCVFQAHPGHARALARVRADAQEQSGLVGARLGHKRKLGEEHLIEPLFADLFLLPWGIRLVEELTRRTCVRHTQRLTTEPRRLARRSDSVGDNRLVVLSCWLGLGHTPDRPNGSALPGEAADPALCVDGPGVEEGLLKERDGGRCDSARSRAKLTNVASTPTIAARAAERVTLLESRTATPSPQNMTG